MATVICMIRSVLQKSVCLSSNIIKNNDQYLVTDYILSFHPL